MRIFVKDKRKQHYTKMQKQESLFYSQCTVSHNFLRFLSSQRKHTLPRSGHFRDKHLLKARKHVAIAFIFLYIPIEKESIQHTSVRPKTIIWIVPVTPLPDTKKGQSDGLV